MRLIKQDLYKKIIVFSQVHEGSTEKATELLHTDRNLNGGWVIRLQKHSMNMCALTER